MLEVLRLVCLPLNVLEGLNFFLNQYTKIGSGNNFLLWHERGCHDDGEAVVRATVQSEDKEKRYVLHWLLSSE